MRELFMVALSAIGKGTLYEVFTVMHHANKDFASSLTLNDVLHAAQELRASGVVEIRYDPKARVDVITTKESA